MFLPEPRKVSEAGLLPALTFAFSTAVLSQPQVVLVPGKPVKVPSSYPMRWVFVLLKRILQDWVGKGSKEDVGRSTFSQAMMEPILPSLQLLTLQNEIAQYNQRRAFNW
ncbi:hypothetical protein BDR07DRAFT_1462782 [Suillus spraguei]|nr:hypothetical protein BDR07DRAFT_1462782 [Suillus spraguei]